MPVKKPAEEVYSIFELFETDHAREQEGVDIRFGKYGSITVRRAGGTNSMYQASLARHSEPYRDLLKVKAKKPDAKTIKILRDVQMHAFVETVVLGWAFVDRQGKAMEFSQKNCFAIFKKMPDLFDQVLDEASSVANFQAKQVAAELGN